MKIVDRLRNGAPALVRDGAGLAGAVMISFGAWSIYAPAGWIVGGLFLIAVAVLAARAS